MKRIFEISSLVFLPFLLLVSQTFANELNELETVREKVSGMFAGINKEDIVDSQVDGWYAVRKGAVVAYISGDARYLFQGDLIDLVDQVNLSEQDRNDARMSMLASIQDDSMIIFTPEKKLHSVSIFTDIDCTFCRRLHSQIDEYMAEGIEIKYFLYPRNGPASESWVKAEQVWCSDNRNSALTRAKLDQEFQTRECDSSIVSSHFSIGQDVGLRGTPAIVLEDGTLVSGYMPAKQLSEAIIESINN